MATKSKLPAATKKGLKIAKTAVPKKSTAVKNTAPAKAKAKSVKPAVELKSTVTKPVKAAPTKVPAKAAVIKNTSSQTPIQKLEVEKPATPIIVNHQNNQPTAKE